jgi:hypothetical protein
MDNYFHMLIVQFYHLINNKLKEGGTLLSKKNLKKSNMKKSEMMINPSAFNLQLPNLSLHNLQVGGT